MCSVLSQQKKKISFANIQFYFNIVFCCQKLCFVTWIVNTDDIHSIDFVFLSVYYLKIIAISMAIDTPVLFLILFFSFYHDKAKGGFALSWSLLLLYKSKKLFFSLLLTIDFTLCHFFVCCHGMESNMNSNANCSRHCYRYQYNHH